MINGRHVQQSTQGYTYSEHEPMAALFMHCCVFPLVAVMLFLSLINGLDPKQNNNPDKQLKTNQVRKGFKRGHCVAWNQLYTCPFILFRMSVMTVMSVMSVMMYVYECGPCRLLTKFSDYSFRRRVKIKVRN